MRFQEGMLCMLAPGVFLRPGIDNSMWADLGDGVVIVDALEDPALAPVIRDAVAKTTGKPLRWVVNTHWHGDHIACNAAWARAGATIIAQEEAGPTTSQHDGQPDITFRDRYVLRGADREVELAWLGGTHTPEDTVVFFPWAQVLHTGDLFGWGMIPVHHLEDALVTRLREVYARLLSYDAQIIVPGHGPTYTPAHLRRFLEYLDDLLARVPALCQSGKSLAEIEAAVPPPDDMRDWWRFTDWKHTRNLQLICESGE